MSRSKRQIAGRTGTANAVPSTVLFGELVLMVDVFCACIETGVFPKHGSPCHRRARWMVDVSGQKPKRKRRRLLSPIKSVTPTK